jgi:hypothetical protein
MGVVTSSASNSYIHANMVPSCTVHVRVGHLLVFLGLVASLRTMIRDGDLAFGSSRVTLDIALKYGQAA